MLIGDITLFLLIINGGYEYAPNSFLFSMTNIYNSVPVIFKCKDDRTALVFALNGPIFGKGNDLGIYENFIEKGGWTNFPETYEDSLGKGKSVFTGDCNIMNDKFKVKEIEVYEVIDK